MDNETLISKIQYSISNTSIKTHYHNEYEIIFITKGQIEISINSKTYIASEGNILLISNYEQHSIKVLRPPYHRYYIILRPQTADKFINNPYLISILKNRPKNFIHCIDMSLATEKITSIFDRILEENKSNNPLRNEFIICCLKELLIYVSRNSDFSISNMPKKIVTDIYEAQKYIDTYFSQKIRISDLAEKFYISSYYLSHAFKKQTGFSPNQYLMLTRLSHACELLITTDYTIAEITDQCGFSDVNNFIRVFKREYKVTPKQFRNLQQKSN